MLDTDILHLLKSEKFNISPIIIIIIIGIQYISYKIAGPHDLKSSCIKLSRNMTLLIIFSYE